MEFKGTDRKRDHQPGSNILVAAERSAHTLVSRPRNSFTKSFDFLDDGLRGGGPDEGFRRLVVVDGEGLYSVDEFFDGPEGAAPDGLLRDDIEPDLDLVEPR